LSCPVLSYPALSCSAACSVLLSHPFPLALAPRTPHSSPPPPWPSLTHSPYAPPHAPCCIQS
jgi:hypothetical protein